MRISIRLLGKEENRHFTVVVLGHVYLDGEIGFDLQEYHPMIILLAWVRERPDATHCFTSCVLADFIIQSLWLFVGTWELVNLYRGPT